jgi:hypothetical protein
MNNSETIGLLAYIEQAWPGRGKYDLDARASVWQDLLCDIDVAEALEATKRLAREGHSFPPAIADILAAVTYNRDGALPTWPEVKALIEGSRTFGFPDNVHPIVRAVNQQVGGPTSLAADSWNADNRVKAAYFGLAERYKREGVPSSSAALTTGDSDIQFGQIGQR